MRQLMNTPALLRSSRASALLVVAVALSLVASEADAAGFAAARFGGEHGNPTETNPSSIYYNPGGIGLSTGTKLTLDLTGALRTGTYDRAVGAISADDPSAENLAVNSGEGSVDNFILSPMFGVTSDFGLDIGLVGGFAFYAPFGGQAVWDDKEGDANFPGSEAGPQRWYTIEGTIRTLAYTFALGYNIKPARLSLGLSGSLLQSSVSTIRARNADGTDNIGTGEFQTEGRSFIDVSSFDYNIGVGALWNPIEDKLWVGLSYTSAPNLTGDQVLEGTLTNLLGQTGQTEENIKFTSSLPDVVRLGGRYRPADNFEIRLFGDYTRWSLLEQQCLINDSVDDIETACQTNSNGTLANTGSDADKVLQVLQRRWEDSFGARLGASWWAIDQVELIIGGGYDSNAVPDSTLEPALIDMDKFTASLGVRYEFLENMGVMVTATNVFYSERDTTSATTAEGFSSPSNQPGSQGVYNQNIFLLGANLELGF